MKAELEALIACERPLLIGVRHHSPACAAAVPRLLDRFAPQRLFVELPVEFGERIPWLGHPSLKTPVALAGVRGDGEGLAFYPFADFSPELAAIRWAQANRIPVEAFDQPMAQRKRGDRTAVVGPRRRSIVDRLLENEGIDDTESLWDRLVEARALGADEEQVRRAGLMVGWTLRSDAAQNGGVGEEDRRREAHMRRQLTGFDGRAAAVVGAFHAAALMPEPLYFSAPDPLPNGGEASQRGDIVTSLIPYSDELLDSRSGYPAGIRDPIWQQQMWQILAHPEEADLEQTVAELIVALCRQVRAEAHVASLPDANEAVRMAFDLARLRGLKGPSRREVLECVESTLAQGELLGRGRVLARALDRVFVGRRRGRLAPETPRSGLLPHVEQLLTELKLPGPGDGSREPKQLRLDPIRSTLDRLRHVALMRLTACGVPYGELTEGVAAGGIETLTRNWTVGWTPATEAMVELASIRGVTLAQAAAGALRAEVSRLTAQEGYTPQAQVALLERAAECGLPGLTTELLRQIVGPFLRDAGLAEVVAALFLLQRIRRGHIPGIPLDASDPSTASPASLPEFCWPDGVDEARLLHAAIRALDGVTGSDRIEDARALLELVSLFTEADSSDMGRLPGFGRLVWAVRKLAEEGGDLMRGAALALLVRLNQESGEAFGTTAGSWVDGATSQQGQRALVLRLSGALVVAAPLFEADPGFCAGLLDRVDALDEDGFFTRLPAMRQGFEVLSPAARSRLLQVLGERLSEGDPQGIGLDVRLDEDATTLARFAQADAAGRAAVERVFDSEVVESAGADEPGEEVVVQQAKTRPQGIDPLDRWRLILGRQREKLSGRSGRAARALDELYGAGQGEGSRSLTGGGGGREEAFPTVREWGEELEALFGAKVREEVLGQAATMGRTGALLALDAEQVSPSIALLEQVLSLKGGLAEAHLHRLRGLVERVVKSLVEELATTIRPALSGLPMPRPTRRPGGPLDIDRTVRANLKNIRRTAAGDPLLIPEQLIFQAKGKRQLGWHIILAVDMSGSMDASVIYSALVSAILSGVPWVSVRFFAFSTEVIDLTEKVADPLGLLLEVVVGGGTHIAKALRFARQQIKVPSRTLVLLVTDFEEGYGVEGLLAEVRALVETGAKGLGLASLDDAGKPRYQHAVAELVVGAGMPVAALTPLELARWVGEQIR